MMNGDGKESPGMLVSMLYRYTAVLLTSFIPVGAKRGGSSGGKDVCYGSVWFTWGI